MSAWFSDLVTGFVYRRTQGQIRDDIPYLVKHKGRSNLHNYYREIDIRYWISTSAILNKANRNLQDPHSSQTLKFHLRNMQ